MYSRVCHVIKSHEAERLTIYGRFDKIPNCIQITKKINEKLFIPYIYTFLKFV